MLCIRRKLPMRIARSAKFISALTLFLFTTVVHAQFDSLRLALQNAKQDSVRLKLCLAIAAQQTNNNLDSTFAYADKAESIAKKMNSPKGIADAQYQRAYAVYYSGAGDSALHMYSRLIADYRALGDSGSVAACFNKAGFIYREKGDRVSAIKQYQMALDANVNNTNPLEAAGSYLNIGLIHHDQEEYDQALQYELKALTIFETIGDPARTCNALLRIGNLYGDTDDDTIAMTYYQRALALAQQVENARLTGICFNNMGGVYSRWGDHRRALALYWQALEIREKIGDLNGSALIINNIGDEYSRLDIYDSAYYFMHKSYVMCDSIGYKEIKMANCLGLSQLFAKQKQFDKAYQWQLEYHKLYEEINREETKKEVSRLNATLEAEENRRNIEHMEQQKLLDDAALSQEKTKGWFLGIVLAIVGVLAIFIFLNNRKTRRTNVLLEAQKTEIAEQKKIVEEQHRDIVDSVNYALRIQQAVMPSRNDLKQMFPESFVIYKPRDIVSGDFWWIAEKGGMKVVVAADCTGHGVPGAFMSLIGTSLLNELVNEKGITDPGVILNMLSARVMQALHQNEERASASDGMDIALAVIDEQADLLMFAGANNSLYYTNIAGELHEIKGDRQPIGYYLDQHRPFNVQTVSLADVTNIYLFTDGYADQFCGNAGVQFGKKFKYSRLKTTLTGVQQLNSLQQKEFMAKTFEDWKGTMFQVDDVLMLGIKFY